MDERKEYSVAFAVRASDANGLVADTDTADELIDLLGDLGPAVNVADLSLEVRVEVVANGSDHAYHEAWERVHRALDRLGLGDWEPERIEISSAEDLERALAEPNMPTLIGVAEIAEQLGVSRQRASELARSDAFPPPLATLAAGPVWAEPTVLRFVQTWRRKPGRPLTYELVSIPSGSVPANQIQALGTPPRPDDGTRVLIFTAHARRPGAAVTLCGKTGFEDKPIGSDASTTFDAARALATPMLQCEECRTALEGEGTA